jgi:hypothetical protein
MIDDYFWNFTGTGYETNSETRVRPQPGYPYYRNSQTRAQRLESLIGIGITEDDEE